MNREIHDIYDVIMKIIIVVYGDSFLKYIGIEKDIKEILETEFVTLNGNKYYLDFLCLLKDGTLCNIEFQFPKYNPDDLDRFFDYNIIAQVRHGKITETIIINFVSKGADEKVRKIGNSKSFHPTYFYLGDVDFKKYYGKINKKVKSNLKLDSFEELSLMLMCLVPECSNKAEILKNISEMLKKENLFDKEKFQFIQAVFKLEINNLLSKEERKEFRDVIKMTPEAEDVVVKAINEVNRKVLYNAKKEAWDEGLAEGRSEGRSEGFAEGRSEGIKEVAKNLKGILSIEEIAKYTSLTVEEIQNL